MALRRIQILWVSPSLTEESAFGYYGKTLVDAASALSEVEITPFAWARGGADARRIDGAARAAKADVIHIQYEPGLFRIGDIRALPSARKAFAPTVATIHRVAAYQGILRPSAAREAATIWKERLLARRIRAAVAHAPHSAGLLAKRYPRLAVALQPMPVPADACNVPRPADGPALYFGNHHPGKGVLEFVEAMQSLPNVPAVVAGRQDPHWAAYNRRVDAALAKAPNVRRVDGWVPDAVKHELFREASVVVLPYRAQGHGSAVLQDAIAHERPVVATDVEPLAETVRELRIGRVAAVDDLPGLAAAIRSTRDDFTEAGRQALAAARAARAPAAVASILVAHYRALVGPT